MKSVLYTSLCIMFLNSFQGLESSQVRLWADQFEEEMPGGELQATSVMNSRQIVAENVLSHPEHVSQDVDFLLMDAAKNGNLGEVTSLIQRGANPLFEGPDKNTALLNAARQGCCATAIRILDMAKRIKTHDTYLFLFSVKKPEYLNINELIDIKDSYGMTALYYASQNGQGNLIEFLLSCGATVDDQAFKYALLSDNPAAVQAFLKRVRKASHIFHEGAKSRSAVYFTARSGKPKALRALLKEHAPATFCTEKGKTALHVACKRGYGKCVDELLMAGASVDPLDKKGWTPLHYAARNGHDRCASSLILYRTNCNREIYIGFSIGGIFSITDRYTPLHLAILGGYTECCRVIFNFGQADSNKIIDGSQIFIDASKNIFGTSAFILAAQHNRPEILRILGSQRSRTNLHASNIFKDNALHVATHAGHHKSMQALIELGVNPDSMNCFNRTPLHLAALKGDVAGLVLLLTYGASANETDSNGETALNLASHNRFSGCVHALLHAGANGDISNLQGKSPMDKALKNEDIESLFLLLAEGCRGNSTFSEGHAEQLIKCFFENCYWLCRSASYKRVEQAYERVSATLIKILHMQTSSTKSPLAELIADDRHLEILVSIGVILAADKELLEDVIEIVLQDLGSSKLQIEKNYDKTFFYHLDSHLVDEQKGSIKNLKKLFFGDLRHANVSPHAKKVRDALLTQIKIRVTECLKSRFRWVCAHWLHETTMGKMLNRLGWEHIDKEIEATVDRHFSSLPSKRTQ